jgi:hypothetical protein
VAAALAAQELAELLTPGKGDAPEGRRAEQLLRLAQACKRQGHFHLACKKYTQAGDRLRAMKALVRSGDTEKVVFFAGGPPLLLCVRRRAMCVGVLGWATARRRLRRR